jgi:uncharacterized integral membrane protein
MANHSRKKAGALTVFALTLIFTIVLSWLNWHASTFNACGLETGLPLAIGFIFSWLTGVVAGWALMLANDKTELNQQKKVEWQAQDVKLMASVASDREKQLEAKITTLEVALKTALKKRG